ARVVLVADLGVGEDDGDVGVDVGGREGDAVVVVGPRRGGRLLGPLRIDLLRQVEPGAVPEAPDAVAGRAHVVDAVALQGDVDGVRLQRIDGDPGDGVAVEGGRVGLQQRPGAAVVGGLEHAAAVVGVAGVVRLAQADVDDVGVRRGHGDGAGEQDLG